jgi:cellulose synthase/poly-beta-1,6-N-acetylglucosamine synthase-like glycosyltransferase
LVLVVILLEILLSLLALVLLVPVSVLFVQVLMALPAYRDREVPQGRRPTVAVLVPAHNEASGIADALGSIIPQLLQGDRLLVIADNCTDDTAEIAATAGAEVIERTDKDRRGKGYALDFGVRHLERNPPDVVLIIDADCQVGVGTIERLSRLCGQTACPVQASNLMHSRECTEVKTRIAEFAWLIKNQVRPFGYHRLGLPCQLMGTGMAFPWPAISTATLESEHIVEDLRLGIDLTRTGTAALFCPEARVTSYFPATAEGIIAQRTRWEHGHIGVILGDAPRMLAEGIVKGNAQLMALALDLSVPPLSLLTLLVLTVFAMSAAFLAATAASLPLWLATAALVMLALSVLMAWARYGRHVLSLSSLAYAPIYALWKIPLYLKFLAKRQADWVRTKRNGD